MSKERSTLEEDLVAALSIVQTTFEIKDKGMEEWLKEMEVLNGLDDENEEDAMLAMQIIGRRATWLLSLALQRIEEAKESWTNLVEENPEEALRILDKAEESRKERDLD